MIKSTIVAEKHIKSILAGQDGSVVKSVSFNAVKTELETYLFAKNGYLLDPDPQMSIFLIFLEISSVCMGFCRVLNESNSPRLKM